MFWSVTIVSGNLSSTVSGNVIMVQYMVRFCPSKTWIKLVKTGQTGQNWTKPKGSYKS